MGETNTTKYDERTRPGLANGQEAAPQHGPSAPSVRYTKASPQSSSDIPVPQPAYRNKNRGYRQLRVWEGARDFYVLVSRVFRAFPYELKRVASQELASADSVHRNIAEGYCRRSLKEYLYYLNVALGSLGESVSGLYVYRQAQQLSEKDFHELNQLAFKLENGLLRLVESLERKQEQGDWIDHLAEEPGGEVIAQREETGGRGNGAIE